jgi:4-amino-4-deoxy-L-arabinose transferase-like glycosyltransferase
MRPKWMRSNRGLLAAMLVCALLRIALMIAAFALTGTHVMTQGDTASYLDPGRNLLLHGSYTSGGFPELDRTPGYPLFAMLTGMAFGNVLSTVVAQILLSLASLLLVRRIAEHTFPNRGAGSIASWLYAIEPLSIVYAVRLLPETLFVFLLLAAIERLLTFQKTAKLTILPAAGILLAAATYVRPVSYYLVLPLALGIALTTPRRPSYRWKAPAVLLISVLPWLAAWQMRNWAETGYSGFSSIVEKNLYFYQSAEVSAELQHIFLSAEQQNLGYLDEASYIAIHPEQQAWSYVQRLQFMRTESTKILSAHRALYLKTHIAGVGVVAFTPCATELLQLLGLYPEQGTMPARILNEGVLSSTKHVVLAHPGVTLTMALLEIFLLLIYILAVRGIFASGATKSSLLTVAGIALYFLIISGGAQAVGRYRLPVMPELCILASDGLAALRAKEKRGNHSPAVETYQLT